MTYCLALRLDEGLVFLADTRTNAGVDNVGTYRKLHVLRPAPDRVFVLAVGGQPGHHPEVLDRIDHDLADPAATTRAWPPSATSSRRRSTSAGSAARSAASTARPERVGADGTATFILGGQIGGDGPTSCSSTPRATTSARPTSARSCRSARASTASSCSSWRLTPRVDLETAIKIALSSMVSTARANLSVGPPYDLGVYRNGSLRVDRDPDRGRLALPHPPGRRLAAAPAGGDLRAAGPGARGPRHVTSRPETFDPIGMMLEGVRSEFVSDDRGHVADYIPQLLHGRPRCVRCRARRRRRVGVRSR